MANIVRFEAFQDVFERRETLFEDPLERAALFNKAASWNSWLKEKQWENGLIVVDDLIPDRIDDLDFLQFEEGHIPLEN